MSASTNGKNLDDLQKDFWRDVRESQKKSVILDEDIEKTKDLFDQALGFISFGRFSYQTPFTDIFGKKRAPQKQAHPFYGIFISQLRQRYTTEVPIAAVSFSMQNLAGELFLNPKNCKNLTGIELGGILVHEVLHVLCAHLSSIETPEFRKNHNICNVAMDASINQILNADDYMLPMRKGIFDENPEQVCHPVSPNSLEETLLEQSKKKGLPTKPELDKEWLYYYNFIMDRIDPQQEMEEGSDHGFWEEYEGMTPEQQEIIKRAIAGKVAESYSQAKNDPNYSGIGKSEEYLQKLIESLNSELPWQYYVSRFLGFIGKPRQIMTSIRMNRYNRPGLMVTKPSSRIGVVLDTSGSVSEDEYAKFLGEVIELSRNHDAEIIMCECSHTISQKPYVLEEYKNIQTRSGYGGTCMRPGIDYFIDEYYERGEHQCNGVIVFSDGELGEDSNIGENELPFPILWVFTRKTGWNPNAGELIHFKKSDKQ